MTPWPSARVSGSLITRAMMSAAPPGAKPTTRRIGLVGYVCAEAVTHALSRIASVIFILNLCATCTTRPRFRVAGLMHDRENRDASWLYDIEDYIGKSRYYRSPHVAIENRKCFGEIADRFESRAQRHQELLPRPGCCASYHSKVD